MIQAIGDMSPQVALALALQELERVKRTTRLFSYFPDDGPLRRELYQKHLEFFRLGATHPTRCFMAANRVGKTEGGGGYEFVLHLTGRYPEWWEGRRFDRPISAWAAGDTSITVRDIIQFKLLGKKGEYGTGLIPEADIVRVTAKAGIADAVDTVTVRHYDSAGNYDGDSTFSLKTYEQGRKAFQGTEQDVIWLDEESEESIRTECMMRLLTTSGLLMETFTPLSGLTKIVLHYLPNGVPDDRVSIGEGRALVMAGWDDVPHLSESDKRRLLADIPPHQQMSRTKGIPSLGAGAIYPVPEDQIVIPDMQMPAHWLRLYGLDVGWNRTAALFAAKDVETDTIYVYSEHYVGQAEPAIHAASIKARGAHLHGVIDPAARGRAQKDGETLLKAYRTEGLDLDIANNGVESGILEVWQRLSTGRLKIFKSLGYFMSEYRIYRRDENGKIVKSNDHLMDCLRYICAAEHKEWRNKEPISRPSAPPWRPRDASMGFSG